MGTSRYATSLIRLSEDHPHAYGDKQYSEICTRPISGSSPRVWGQGSSNALIRIDLGIIPTRMGTSNAAVDAVNRNADHPHAYGDKLLPLGLSLF